jgi:hypothetical protein
MMKYLSCTNDLPSIPGWLLEHTIPRKIADATHDIEFPRDQDILIVLTLAKNPVIILKCSSPDLGNETTENACDDTQSVCVHAGRTSISKKQSHDSILTVHVPLLQGRS